MRELSRRDFLAATGGLVTTGVGASLLGSALVTEAAAAATGRAAPGGGNTELSFLMLSSDLYASPEPQRLIFSIAKGPRFAATKPARIALAPPGTQEGTVLDTVLHREGLPKGRGIYSVDVVLPESGVWEGVVLTRGERVGVVVEVKATADAPVVGTAAPRVASPTRAERLGTKPLCTRRPRCPLHDVSLDRVIGAGRPVAVMFATPALCQSQYCGPVLDQLLEVRDEYRDRIELVHVEIYRSNRGVERVPTVDDWGLPSEPWLFGIDATGTITARLDGAMATDEIDALLGRLAG